MINFTQNGIVRSLYQRVPDSSLGNGNLVLNLPPNAYPLQVIAINAANADLLNFVLQTNALDELTTIDDLLQNTTTFFPIIKVPKGHTQVTTGNIYPIRYTWTPAFTTGYLDTYLIYTVL